MAKERPPVLSVLLDNERKARFQQIAQSEGRSMGWVIKDMIDRVIAANTIHVYGESHPQSIATGGQPMKVSTDYVSMAVLTEYVGDAIAPLSNDLLNLQAQVAEVKSDCDLTTEGIQRLIADAISKAPIAPRPSAAVRTAPAQGNVHNEVLKVAKRLEKEPALKSAVIAGLAAGYTGESLGQYLADNGFLNGNGGKYTGASNSRFRLAIEYLNNGGQTND
jgi:hypothetical protein